MEKNDKIIRVIFSCFDTKFCIDRPFDSAKSDQENCDGALSTLIDSMKNHSVVPALEIDKEDRGHPIFMNLGLVPFVGITNVGVYTVPAIPKSKSDESK